MPFDFDCSTNADGYVIGEIIIHLNFVFPGNSYRNNFPLSPSNWFSNSTYGNLDTKILASSGEISFAPNQLLTLSYVQVATNALGTSDRNYMELQVHI